MIEEPLNLWAWQQLHAIRNFDTYSETPWFNTFQHKFFIFSSITTYYARLPSAFLDGCLRHSYSQWVDHLQTVVLDPFANLSRHYGAVGLPATLFINPDGTLAASHLGEISREALSERLAALSSSATASTE